MEAILHVRSLAKVTQLSNRNVLTVIMAMILLIIILSIVLASVAFVQNDELSEDNDFDDFFAMGGWAAIWTITFTTISFLLNLDLEFLILAVVAEYLRSHIGEKRFSDRAIEFNKLFLNSDSLMTAAFKAVISFSICRLIQIHVHKLKNVLFPISGIYSTSSFVNIITTQGGSLS